jgi:hypothetical protein
MAVIATDEATSAVAVLSTLWTGYANVVVAHLAGAAFAFVCTDTTVAVIVAGFTGGAIFVLLTRPTVIVTTDEAVGTVLVFDTLWTRDAIVVIAHLAGDTIAIVVAFFLFLSRADAIVANLAVFAVFVLNALSTGDAEASVANFFRAAIAVVVTLLLLIDTATIMANLAVFAVCVLITGTASTVAVANEASLAVLVIGTSPFREYQVRNTRSVLTDLT